MSGALQMLQETMTFAALTGIPEFDKGKSQRRFSPFKCTDSVLDEG